MPMILQGGPFKAPVAGFHRFTIDQYHKMIEVGVLTEDDRVELLEGYLVEKMPHDPLHDGTLQLVAGTVMEYAPVGWCERVQMAVTLGRSEPEPDFVLARGNHRTYLKRHPGPGDIALVVEVSNSTLESDRDDKLPIYSRIGLPVYWIVNVVEMQVEVHEQPAGLKYAKTTVYKKGDTIPLEVDGMVVASIPVNDLLP
jgi:Uma2 family endonuclease